MRRLLAILSLAAAIVSISWARTGRSSPRSERRTERPTRRSERPRSTRCAECQRAANGRIARSAAAIREFRQANPCPATGRTTGVCPGYQIDHRVPLSKGGADQPANMQWLTTEEHQAKTAADRR